MRLSTYCTLLVLCWLEIMDCCVEGYLTNFFAHCTMIMEEMDGDSTLCFFLKTWVPCAHLPQRRLKNLLPNNRPWLILQNLWDDIPSFAVSASSTLSSYSFLGKLLLNAVYPASRPLGPVSWWTSWFSWATSLCTWWWWRSFATCWSRTSRILRREKGTTINGQCYKKKKT